MIPTGYLKVLKDLLVNSLLRIYSFGEGDANINGNWCHYVKEKRVATHALRKFERFSARRVFSPHELFRFSSFRGERRVGPKSKIHFLNSFFSPLDGLVAINWLSTNFPLNPVNTSILDATVTSFSPPTVAQPLAWLPR